GVVARIREARGRLEQDLELEEQLLLVFDGELREPAIALSASVYRERAGSAQQIGVGVAVSERGRLPRRRVEYGRHPRKPSGIEVEGIVDGRLHASRRLGKLDRADDVDDAIDDHR